MRSMSRFRAFTLIELLIVVAIIAILAAIAVPNFLEAQVRSKVSRAKADMRTCATALEAYRTDNNRYPPDNYAPSVNQRLFPLWDQWRLNPTITTPIAYLTSAAAMVDPFNVEADPLYKTHRYVNLRYTYVDWYLDNGQDPGDFLRGRSAEYRDLYFGEWQMLCHGPDKVFGPQWGGGSPWLCSVPYDPTNGTVSQGDVVRSQAVSDGYKLPQ